MFYFYSAFQEPKDASQNNKQLANKIHQTIRGDIQTNRCLQQLQIINNKRSFNQMMNINYVKKVVM